MKVFQINKNISVVCNSENTRYGFRHLATLMIDGKEADKAKCCYYNRTWEKYEFESVLKELAEKTQVLSENEKKEFNQFISRDQTDNSDLKMIGGIAKLGNVFAKDTKEKNDWKLRMIKAGLEKKGLSVPDDWDKLSENEKEKRLNEIIELLKETK